MPRLCLNIHGIAVLLESDSSATVDALRRDFAWFEATSERPGAIRLTLHARRPPDGAGGWALLRTSEFRARGAGALRRIDYSDGAAASYDFDSLEGSIWAPEPGRLHELAYLAVLSRAGEALDELGLHRVHALGFTLDGRGGLLLLPSGGGKSVLGLELLSASERVGVLSDDTPVLDSRGRLRAFPLRWGFLPDADLSRVPPALVRPFARRRYGPKKLVDVEYFRDRVRDDVPLEWLLIGSRAAEPRLEPASGAGALAALADQLVVGRGIAQMAEYRLRARPRDLFGLARHALMRLRAAFGAARRARVARFALGPDAAGSARALLAGLEAL